MNRPKIRKFVIDNQIIPMRADVEKGGPDVGQLLVELGNPAKGIPYYAVFPAGGGKPIIFGNTLITQNQVLEALKQAAALAGVQEEAATVMNAQ